MDGLRGYNSGAVVTAPTREGPLRLELGPRHVRLELADRTLHVADRYLTLTTRSGRREKRDAHRLAGPLWLARDVPHDDLGLWEQVEPGSVRRVFGVEPRSLIEPDGLDALRALDQLATRLRLALQPLAGDVLRAVEIGRGLDKVLLIDRGDRYELFMRRLFRDRARFILEVRRDGTVVLPEGGGRRTLECRSRFGVTVLGDYVRFSDPTGLDLGRVAVPWICRQDRDELVRRIGNFIDHGGLHPADVRVAGGRL